MMTNQEVFDHIVAHARAQKCRAADERGNCRYRIVKNGMVLKCFAGCLIPEEDYNHEWERTVVTQEGYPIYEYFQSRVENIDLLRTLQIVHDNIDEEDWEENFQRIAWANNLVYSAP